MSINDLKIGQCAIIDTIAGDTRLTKRLMALGYTKGTKVMLKTAAPLGDPVIINLRGFNLALRKKDAKNIKVREL
ncbi:MAG TPA: ferrous iron transport protein A [Clostridiaceae bacterium]|jgi:ferrous iron transport protein A|nr:ferrous iron transport protein A [Clostridiaceae bacterium]